MATENGLVIRTFGTKAIVKTLKSEACAGCASQHSCTSKGDDMEVEVTNPVGAKEGDRVVIHLAAASFLKATFLMYVFPILCLIAGAVTGERIAVWQGWEDDTNLSVFLGFVFFLLSVLVVKIKGRRMGEQDSYRPKVIRIL